jgi:hypothetical protein
MLYALVDGIKSRAFPSIKGTCPFCDCTMVAKCGEFKSWHWAHKQTYSCDAWYKRESEWHRNWKEIFGISNCEIIINKDNEKHIADIRNIHGRIIELQNSPINTETIRSREEFYGYNMIWIVNGWQFAQNFVIRPFKDIEYDTYSPEFERFAKMHGFKTNYRPLTGEEKARFEWKRPKEVWRYARATVYFDFGDQFLFQVQEGLGCSKSTGTSVPKRDFVTKNGGDTSLVDKLIVRTAIA